MWIGIAVCLILHALAWMDSHYHTPFPFASFIYWVLVYLLIIYLLFNIMFTQHKYIILNKVYYYYYYFPVVLVTILISYQNAA